MSCPMGYKSADDTAATEAQGFRDVDARITKTMISCSVATNALAQCRARVATKGEGSCAREAKMHTLCKQTQLLDQSRIEACGRGGLKRHEREYIHCHKTAWFWTDCLGPLKEFAACAESLSQRPN
eukprot:m.233914 g.233914  ORF g.233914 m.233914 type:complete len:126 (+) comp26106_c2_seq1:557-934(+)